MEMKAYKHGLIAVFILQILVRVNSQRASCAECSGGTTVCDTVRGILGITIMSKGYNPVVTIPEGACNINITEAARSENHLALRTTDGDYLFTGQWMVSNPGVYMVGGTSIVYSRQDDRCPGECIRAVGPTDRELTVQLLYHGRSPGIYYSFQTHPRIKPGRNNNNNNKDPAHVSGSRQPNPGFGELREPEIGSKTFGTPEPVTIVDKSKLDTSTPGSFPEYSPFPSGSDITRRGPIFSNEFTRFRPQQHKEGPYVTKPVKPANQKQREALTDKTYSRGINDVDFQIESEEFSGDGDLSNVVEKEENVYQAELENITEGPVVNVLDEYRWAVSGFSECSRPCGGGIQEHKHICVGAYALQVVDSSYCENIIKPEVLYQVCNTEACTPMWIEGEWSECSVTCGEGRRTRAVTCQQRVSATVSRVLPEKHCVSGKSATVRACYGEECHSWKVGDWGQCSTSCGEGIRQRRVKCIDGHGNSVNRKKCVESAPLSEESCDMGSCTRHWYYSKWSGTCLNNCDAGIVTREVHCSTDGGRVLADSKCKRADRPKSKLTCSQGVTCGGKWFVGPWSKCSQSCGEGVRARHIVCMKKIGDQQVVTSDDNCVDDKQPGTTETCSESECGHTWFMTDWSECSKTCGGGVKTRAVLCMLNGDQFSNLCDIGIRPESSIRCNTDKCVRRPRQKKKGCVNKYPNCHVVVQARLCRYWYYQRKCCASCSENLHGSNTLI